MLSVDTDDDDDDENDEVGKKTSTSRRASKIIDAINFNDGIR